MPSQYVVLLNSPLIVKMEVTRKVRSCLIGNLSLIWHEWQAFSKWIATVSIDVSEKYIFLVITKVMETLYALQTQKSNEMKILQTKKRWSCAIKWRKLAIKGDMDSIKP